MTSKLATFTYAHGSGRFDRSPESLKQWLNEAMKRASLVSGTEVYGKRRTAELHTEGWDYHSGHNGDADQLYLCWLLEDWTSEAQEEMTVTDQQYQRAGGAMAPKNELLVTVLRNNATGFRLAHILGHYPAGVQGHGGPFGFFNTLQRRVGVSLAAIRGAKKVKKLVKHTYAPDGIMLGGDWNLAMEQTAVRVFFKALFPRATVNFSSFSGPGTLGKRFIDVFYLWGLKVVTNPLVRSTKASDHRWYVQDLAFTSKRLPAGRPARRA